MEEKHWSPRALQVCLVCDTIFQMALIAGGAYLVFWRDQSGWILFWAIVLACCCSCRRFRSPAQIAADPDK